MYPKHHLPRRLKHPRLAVDVALANLLLQRMGPNMAFSMAPSAVSIQENMTLYQLINEFLEVPRDATKEGLYLYIQTTNCRRRLLATVFENIDWGEHS